MPTQTPEKRKLFASTLETQVGRVLVGFLSLDRVVTGLRSTRVTREMHYRKNPIFAVRGLAIGLLLVLVSITGVSIFHPAKSVAATNSTVNFQARLMSAAGAIAADGNYNVEFKLYSGSTGGTALWTEDYLNANTQGIRVANGYLSANLGSITAFPSTINWDQNLYLGMTVRGTGSCSFGSCTPGDSEMTPRLQLTSTPYAFSAGKVSQYNGTTGYTSTFSLQAPTGGNQIFQVPDQGAAGTYNLLTQETAATSYIQLQSGSPGTAQTGNINITGTGIAGALQSSTFDTPSSGALSIGTSNASSISISKSGVTTTINGGLSVSGGAVTLTGNAASSLKTADTTASATITIQTGNSSSGTAGAVSIDTGTSSTGTSVVNIGTTNAGSVSIGKTGTTTTVNGALTSTQLLSANGGITIGASAGSGTVLTNNGATVNSTLALSNFDYTGSSNTGSLGSAASTVDVYTAISVAQTTAGQTLTLATPTASTGYGRLLYISNIGSTLFTLLGTPLKPGATAALVWSNTNGGASWQYSGADGNSILNQSSSAQAANFSIQAPTSTVAATIQGASGKDILDLVGSAGGSPIVKFDQNGGITASGGTFTNSTSTSNFAFKVVQTNLNTSSTLATVNTVSLTIQGTNNSNVGDNVNNALNFNNVTTRTNNVFNGLYFGTNYDSLLNYNGNSVIGGTGKLQNYGFDTSINYSNLQTVTNLTTTGNITIGSSAGSGTVFTNNGATLNSTLALGNFSSGGSIGTAAATVDKYTAVSVAQTTASQALTIPTPTNAAAGRIVYLTNAGSVNFTVSGLTLTPGAVLEGIWNGAFWTAVGLDGGTTTVGTIDSQTASSNGAVISGTSIYLQSASATNPGLINTGTQTIAGAKTLSGNVTIGSSAGSGTVFTNNGATLNTTLVKTDYASGGSIGTAAATVDIYSAVSVAQTTSGQTLTIPTPTASTTYGRLFYVTNVGTASFILAGASINPGTTTTVVWSNTNGAASWSLASSGGILNQTSTSQTGGFKISGTGYAAGFDAATAGALNIGSSVATSLSIGNATSATSLSLLAGTGGVTIGNSGVANTIQIGNTTGAVAQTINIGNNATASSTSTVAIGSTIGSSATTVQAGTGNLNLLTNSASASITAKTNTNSTTAFQIQNANSDALLVADTSNATIKVSGTTTTFAIFQLDNAHFKSTQTTAPTIGTPTNCGSSPSAAVTAGSTDAAGSFTVTTGGGGGTTCDTTLTFNKAYGAAPKAILLTPASGTGGNKLIYISGSSTTTFTIKYGTGATAPGAAEANTFSYWVIE